MKIAFFSLRDFDELPLCEELAASYGMEFVWTPDPISEENLSLAEGCIAVSSTPCYFPEAFADRLHEMGVKYVTCRSIGFDHLPLGRLAELGMRAANTAYPTECVANHALMLILMTTRRTGMAMAGVANQDFSLRGKMGREIGGLTVGVLGTGHIGRVLISHLAPFGCRILAYDKYPSAELAGLAEYKSFDEVLVESDVISVHMPASDETHHLLDDAAFAKMKDGVCIVNTARGSLIDSFALMRAIRSGKVSGAGLDVIEAENDLVYHDLHGQALDHDEYYALKSFPNIILTGHTAFYTETTIRCMVEDSFRSVALFEEGKENPREVG